MSRIFVSYARESSKDGDKGLVPIFVDDLRAEVGRLSRIPKDEIVYLDVAVDLGTDWWAKMADEIRQCDVFLAFYSPHYFESVYCRQEWKLFAQRLEELGKRPGAVLPTLVPVLWERPSEWFVVPDYAQMNQYANMYTDAFSRKRSLRRIVQLPGDRSDYEDAVQYLAETVLKWTKRDSRTDVGEPIDRTAATALVAKPAEPSTAPDRPPPVDGPVVPRNAATGQSSGGPTNVHFVIAAATADEMRDQRDTTVVYGEEPLAWSPYAPTHAHPLAQYAWDVARGRDMSGWTRAVDDGLMTLIKAKEQANSLVILLVDPWTVRLPRYQALLRDFDDGLSLHTAAVAPRNDADPATSAAGDVLDRGLHEVFGKHRTVRSAVFSDSAGSLDEFRSELERVILETQAQIIAKAGNYRRARPGSRGTRLPRIDGPAT